MSYEGFGPTLAHEKLTELHGLEFIVDYNRRFARASRSEHDAHRPLQPSEGARRAAG